MADSVETSGVDFRTRVKRLGATENARRKKSKLSFSIIKSSKAFPKSYMKVVVKKVIITSGHGASKDLENTCSGFGSHSKVKIEEADGSSSGKKCELSTLATQYSAEGVWTGKCYHEQREAWVKQI